MVFHIRSRPEWFECRQFDMLAEKTGVHLAEGPRYCFAKRVALAQYVYDTRVIRFNKKLFTGKQLTDKGRCGVVVHELWHSVTATSVKGYMRTFRYLAVPFDLLRLSAVVAVICILPLALLGNPWLAEILTEYFLVALIAVLVLRFLVIPTYLKKRLWPAEYESDEAAAKFMGVPATEEFLKTQRPGSGPPTHPRTRDRLRRLGELAVKYTVPYVDFDLLQNECKQEFTYLGNAPLMRQTSSS